MSIISQKYILCIWKYSTGKVGVPGTCTLPCSWLFLSWYMCRVCVPLKQNWVQELTELFRFATGYGYHFGFKTNSFFTVWILGMRTIPGSRATNFLWYGYRVCVPKNRCLTIATPVCVLSTCTTAPDL